MSLGRLKKRLSALEKKLGTADLKPGDLIKTEEAAKILGTTPGTMTVWRHQGKGPKFCKIGHNVMYYLPHLKEWVLSRCVSSTMEMK